MPYYGTQLAKSYRYAKYGPRIAQAAMTGAKRMPYVGAALTAAELGYQAYNAMKSAGIKFPGKGQKVGSSKKRGRPAGSKNKPKQVSKPAKSKSYKYGGNSTYAGKTKKLTRKTPKNNYFNLRGSVKVNEFGGTLNADSTQAVYLHHGVAQSEVLRSVFRAIIKELFRQARVDIQNWNNTPENTNILPNTRQFYIQLNYVNAPSQAGATVTALPYQPADGATYNDMALAFLNEWLNSQGTGDEAREYIDISMRSIGRNENDTTVLYHSLAYINLKQARFDFDITSSLMLQNRTLAEVSSPGESAADRDNILYVENVPLVGKQYSNVKKWRNFLDVQLRSQFAQNVAGDAFAKRLTANDETGIIQFESSTNAPVHLKKPPAAYVLGYKASKGLKINPGDMIKDKWHFKTHMSMSSILSKFSHYLGHSSSSTTQSNRIDFGFIQGVGLEKMIDTARSSGSQLSLGYQLTQKYACALSLGKRVSSNTIINDTSTPISYTTDEPST